MIDKKNATKETDRLEFYSDGVFAIAITRVWDQILIQLTLTQTVL